MHLHESPSCLLYQVLSTGRLCAAQVMHTKRTLHAKIIQRERQRQATMAAEKAAAAGPGSEAGAGAGKAQQAKKRARSGEEDGWDEEDGSDSAGSSGEEGSDGGDEGAAEGSGRAARMAAAKAAAALTATTGDGVGGRTSYRDPGLYVGKTKGEGTNYDPTFDVEHKVAELQAAVLDLTAEDREGMAEQKRRYHWDKRAKKYVQLGANETVKGGKRVRTESGRNVELTSATQNRGLYQKWVKATHQRVAADGAHEDTSVNRELANRCGTRGWGRR